MSDWINTALFYAIVWEFWYMWYRLYRHSIRGRKTKQQKIIIRIGYLSVFILLFVVIHFGMFHLVRQNPR